MALPSIRPCRLRLQKPCQRSCHLSILIPESSRKEFAPSVTSPRMLLLFQDVDCKQLWRIYEVSQIHRSARIRFDYRRYWRQTRMGLHAEKLWRGVHETRWVSGLAAEDEPAGDRNLLCQ